MHFIQKSQSPDFFEQEKRNVPLTEWDSFKNPCKGKLKSFLLYEQHNLCGYCEREISPDNSHFEHLAPQKKYPELRFEYKNLIASCNGTFLNATSRRTIDKQSCGHRKEDKYNPELFLNPVAVSDISAYFNFDPDTGKMKPVDEDVKSAKADYTIGVLNLNSRYLCNARKNSKEILIEECVKQMQLSPEQGEKILRAELASDREFITFLRYCFRGI